MIDSVSWKNDVEHALVSDTLGRIVIPEPINYEDGNRNIYERDDESKGFLTAKSNELEFYGAAVDALKRQIYTKGIVEDILLEKKIKSNDRLDELWRTTQPIFLDLKELKFEDKKGGGALAKTKAIEGGLKKIIDARISDEYDLKSTLDADGNQIEPLQTENILLEAREIFLRSEAIVEDGKEIRAAVTGGDNLNAISVPFVFDINSDQDNILSLRGTSKLNAANNDFARLQPGNQNNVTFYRVSANKQLTLNGRVRFSLPINDIPTGRNELAIVIYDFDFNVVSQRKLMDFNPLGNNTWTYDFVDEKVDVPVGHSMTIALLSDTNDDIKYNFTDTYMTFEEDSFFPPSQCKALTYKQALNRVLYIITGENNLVDSELLENGLLSSDLITNGYYIRNFPDIVNEGTDEERRIQFNVSLENILNHIEALLPKAWWIEKKGNKEYFRLEKYSYTQQNNITIPFGEKDSNGNVIYIEASDIKREVLGDNFYSIIETGSEKGGDDYEEINGLRSINGKATFSTINNNNDSKYSKLSPFRLGDVDVEIPRRKPYSLLPEQDTRYDSDIMCIRCKKINNEYVIKKWQDVYEEVPTGIYRPNSAYNLDITPARLLLEHSANINSALYHYPNGKLVFASSNCNSSFKSKKPNENVLDEGGTIAHNRLKKPTIRPFTLECKAPVTQELEDVITGETNGVKNWFGIVALKTGTEIEYFRLIKTDVNKEGKHKFIEASL